MNTIMYIHSSASVWQTQVNLCQTLHVNTGEQFDHFALKYEQMVKSVLGVTRMPDAHRKAKSVLRQAIVTGVAYVTLRGKPMQRRHVEAALRRTRRRTRR